DSFTSTSTFFSPGLTPTVVAPLVLFAVRTPTTVYVPGMTLAKRYSLFSLVFVVSLTAPLSSRSSTRMPAPCGRPVPSTSLPWMLAVPDPPSLPGSTSSILTVSVVTRPAPLTNCTVTSNLPFWSVGASSTADQRPFSGSADLPGVSCVLGGTLPSGPGLPTKNTTSLIFDSGSKPTALTGSASPLTRLFGQFTNLTPSGGLPSNT